MASSFDKLLYIGDRVNHKHNGEPAIFAYNNLQNTAPVTVIFEKSKELIVVQGENEVVTRRPVAYIEWDQLTELGLPKPKKRDQITIQGIVYDIVAVPDDGHNETEMHLEKE